MINQNIFGIINNLSLWFLSILIVSVFAWFKFHKMKEEHNNQLRKEKMDNEFLATILNHVSECALVIDENNVIRSINDRVSDYFGDKTENLIGRDIQRLHTDFIADDHREAMKANFAYGNSYQTEVKFFSPDGAVIPFDIQIIQYIFNNKSYYGVIARDVHAIIGREKTISEQEHRLDEISHIAKLGYWEINHITGEISWSRELYNILGYEINAVKPNLDMLFSRVHPDDVEQMTKAFVDALQNQEMVDIRSRILDVDNNTIDVIIRIRHIFSADNEHTSTIGLIQDITEEGELRDNLELQHQYYRFIAESSDLLILTTNAEGGIADVNPFIEKLTGKRKQELIGKPADTIFGKVGRWHSENVDDLGSYEVGLRIEDKDGEDRHILWNTREIKYRNVDVRLSLGMDATETVRYKRQYEYQAYHDVVTGLPNRFKIEEVMDRYIERNLDKHWKNMALLFISLTRFMEVSDLYGMEVEDKLIIAVSDRLKAHFGRLGLLARFNNDLLAFFLPEPTKRGGVSTICNQILDALKEPFEIDDYRFSVGAQIGVAQFPDDAANRKELERMAHAAVNQARSDRNIDYYVFDNALKESIDYSRSNFNA